MALEPGTRFGPHEITGSLGAGGMGEVYRARDTKLGREVAIKTLPAALAGDQERLARFEREAQLLAALNHANIASIYSLDEHEGTLYLAMELVEGETLEHKLKRGALAVDEALRIALQIAEALEAAHGRGVVHRDLKPANVMLTGDGVVKVLDFGIAKAFSGNPDQANPAHSPALSLATTQAGLLLGTAGYMSPEQASGQATDQRADVWAFGVVLYEMLTGEPVFGGESVPHIVAGVLRAEPDWTRLPKRLHPRLKLLLERCLTKKPRNRLHSIADARVEIEAVLGDPEGAKVERASGVPSRRSAGARWLVVAVAGIALLTGAAGWLALRAPPPEAPPVVRFSIPLDQTFSPSSLFSGSEQMSMIALSADGTRIAYVANGQIYLRNVGESEIRPMRGTAESGNGPASPAFSPDGQWLAYVHFASAAEPFVIKRVPTNGGVAVPVHAVEEVRGVGDFPHGLTWPAPDTMLFADPEGIVRVPANGGAREVLVARSEDERLYSPQLLPGGESVLFTRVPGRLGVTGGYEEAQVVVQSIGADDRAVVREGGSAAKYLPSGHLVYAQGTTLFAIPFDPSTRATRGGPVPIVQGLRDSSSGLSDTANFAVSDTGTLVLIAGDTEAGSAPRVETTLAWVDRSGREEPVPIRADDYRLARISPDGTQVALMIGQNRSAAIWIYDRRTENLSLLTAESGSEFPIWSSDGSRIFFRSWIGPSLTGVYAIEMESGQRTLVASSPDFPYAAPWSIAPDDLMLALVNAINFNDVNIATLSLPDGELARLLHDPQPENEPSISPDGAWLAYHEGTGAGAFEINIRPFPGVTRTRSPLGPGQSPVFSRNGSELFFFDGRGIATAPVTYEPSLRVGLPQPLFESDEYLWVSIGRAWDVDPDGQRFLMIRAPAASAAAGGVEPERLRIDVVLNWFEELERRVPVE